LIIGAFDKVAKPSERQDVCDIPSFSLLCPPLKEASYEAMSRGELTSPNTPSILYSVTETFFGEIATLGTILVALVYLVSNIALPVYYRRHHPDQFSLLKHLILPILGVLAIGFPLWALVQPGQPAPFNLFPWIALAIVVLALIYATILSRRDPTLWDRVGSIIADRE
jgi:amino acid transporter